MTGKPTTPPPASEPDNGGDKTFSDGILHFLGLGLSKGRSNRGNFYPMSVATHGVLLLIGWLAALTVYQWVSSSLYNDYQTSLKQASVLCDFLTDYGSSSHFDCDKENKVRFYERDTDEKTKKASSLGQQSAYLRLSTKDLASMMIAAGIEDAKDLEEPSTLLLLDKSGPGGWIATAILSAATPSTERLDSLMLSGSAIGCSSIGNTDPENIDFVPFGTIDALNVLFGKLGKKSGKGEGCEDDLKEIRGITDTMVKNITGQPPRFWQPFQDAQTKSTSNAIKSAMSVPWDHYMPSVIFHAPGDIDCNSKLPTQLPTISTTANGVHNYYVESKETVCIDETLWYRYDPSKIYHAAFSFGTFLLNEVFRDDTVKQERFLYQAWRGPIQFCLLVISFYLLFVLVWRFVASLKQVGVDHIGPFWRAALVQGVISDREQQAMDSRAYIDLMISTLPLIGLFGTVIGILFGLPNAADAVTAVGPGATDAVNALFENLGLAFSTTAIAVLSVIILEVIWLILQRFEEQCISDYLERSEAAK